MARLSLCVPTDEESLQVAQIRINTTLGILIDSCIKQGTITLWEDIKRVMNAQFQITTNITEAWQQSEKRTLLVR